MNEELITIIEQLKNNFSYDDISDYQNLLLIIYNSIFLDEDHLTSDLKYKIFETLSTIINNIQIRKNNEIMTKSVEEYVNILEQIIIPYYMRNNNITLRHQMHNHLTIQTKDH